MNIPSTLVLFIGGWGVASNTKENFFYNGKFSFLEEAISAYPSLTISKPTNSCLDTYQILGAKQDSDSGLTQILASHQLKLITVSGAERYGCLHESFLTGEEVIDDNQKYYLSVPPSVNLAEHPETILPELTKVVENQLKYTKDAVIFVAIETITTLLRYNNPESLTMAIQQVDKCVKKLIADALANGMNILLVGDSCGAESAGKPVEEQADLLPVVLIAKELEGLRASELDYGSGSLFPLHPSGTLQDIAPTILSLMQIPQPESIPGKTLFKEQLTHL